MEARSEQNLKSSLSFSLQLPARAAATHALVAPAATCCSSAPSHARAGRRLALMRRSACQGCRAPHAPDARAPADPASSSLMRCSEGAAAAGRPLLLSALGRPPPGFSCAGARARGAARPALGVVPATPCGRRLVRLWRSAWGVGGRHALLACHACRRLRSPPRAACAAGDDGHARRLLWSRRQISCAGPSAGTPHARPVASSAVSGVAPLLLMRHRGPSRRRRVRSSRARLRRGGPAVVLSGHTHGHIQVSAPSILGLGFIMRFGDFLNEI